jgi:hypothetical protein
MAIDIQQYRASIGSFNSGFNSFRKHSSKTRNFKPTEYRNAKTTFLLAISLIVLSLIVFGNFYQYYESCKTSSTSKLISSSLQQEDTCCSGVFISTLFSMVSNFESRYKYGNRKAKGIKIAHCNKGGSHLVNKMP